MCLSELQFMSLDFSLFKSYSHEDWCPYYDQTKPKLSTTKNKVHKDHRSSAP